MSTSGWIGVDLDGTIAHYDGWKGVEHIGAPIKPMVDRVKAWLKDGVSVKIFTARASHDPDGSITRHIETWCQEHLGQILPVTNAKDFAMVELWDDRCVQVEINTGKRIGEAA